MNIESACSVYSFYSVRARLNPEFKQDDRKKTEDITIGTVKEKMEVSKRAENSKASKGNNNI